MERTVEIFGWLSEHLPEGLQLKISLLANSGTFTEMLINVHCPFKLINDLVHDIVNI